jgi:hypothetical protein
MRRQIPPHVTRQNPPPNQARSTFELSGKVFGDKPVRGQRGVDSGPAEVERGIAAGEVVTADGRPLRRRQTQLPKPGEVRP